MDESRLTSDFDRAQLDGVVIGRNHPEYAKRRRVWNGTVDRQPAVIIRAGSVADVVKVIGIAAERGSLLAVRCGGHSFPGLSTCNNGVVLDLSPMNQVVVDIAKRIARVEGGALLGDLDRAAVPLGLVTPAGIVSHTGVAGLTLGGGMGWLSRRFGLTIDNLLAADVATADGRVISTSAEKEPELFWGIRGGGGNFGVVTRFQFRTVPLDPIMVGRWTYATADARAALSRYRACLEGAPRELTTALTITSAELTITALWSGAGKHAEDALSQFGALARPTAGTLGGMSFLELQSRVDEHFAWGRRYYAKGGYFRDIEARVIDAIVESIASAPTPHSEVYLLQLGGAIGDVEDSATPYTGRDAGFYWIVEPVWDDTADDERCMAWGRDSAGRLTALSSRGNYINEQSDVGKHVTLAAYGAQKYDRLARLKARYDPTNLFRLNQNIEPKS